MIGRPAILRLVGAINRVAGHAASLLLATLVLVVLASIVCRYILNDSIVWAEELCRYLFLWVIFLAAGVGVGERIHIGLDVLVDRASPAVRLGIQHVGMAIIVAFLVALIVAGLRFARVAMATSALLLPVPMGIVYLCLPVGAALMLVNVLAAGPAREEP